MDEGSSPEGALPAKYQKLAYEYSKLRAQAQVLKKAVSEEQSRNAELKDALKDKEQGVRKLEQEVESLNFCNQQLTKRVGFLQEELEGDRSKKDKKKKAAAPSPVHQGVIDAELQSRIEENEKLHLQVSSAEFEHRRTVERLEEELEQARRAVNAREGQLSQTLSLQEETISRLTQERARLELKLKSCEKELKDVSLRNEMSEAELRDVKQNLGTRLRAATRTIEQTVLFKDSGDGRACGLDVPVTTGAQESGVRALLCQLAELLPEAGQALSSLHTYSEQRVRLLLATTSGPQGPLLRFAEHLHSNVSHLQPIEEAYQSYFDAVCRDGLYLLDGGPALEQLSLAVSKYACYLNKLLPYVALSLGAAALSPDAKSRELRARLGQTAARVAVKFGKLDRYLQLLAAKGCQPCANGCHCAGYVAVASHLVKVAKTLWEDFEDAKKQLSSLMLLEHELPTVSAEAKTTDDCLISSLVSVVGCCKKISKALETHSHLILGDQAYQRRGLRSTSSQPQPLCRSHLGPLVGRLRQRGASYLRSCLPVQPPDSVPYKVAIENSGALRSHVENQESFTQQLESCTAKVRKLEEEKEHWMLEWQLMQAKFERQTKDLLHDGPMMPGDSGDGQLIASHLKARIREMIRQNQLADSKAVYFHAECKALQQRLLLAEQRRTELERQLQETQLTVHQLREELGSMSRSYEDQLSTMSEHLASMNEKLTQQKDEIDALRHNSKLGKKLKPK
ncbi:protein phosphatase 1 regulatory subunit 21 isoform X1 [Ixodes scapularis]|uniref:protein phosphatase 1 regulatory subunit 21 isoform X1 n=1 Tax=Ixodes scapularis TaxID=6945 RepID=UPI0011616A82|nr:protein phosphatase 1 regulatory subunit 21 isoform X1 [Ixodes scapularis]